ncbi:MAG: hypothetical protein RLY71_782 [Pseudomonadota bacterium]|jgi:hypothetical protein
MLSITSNCYSAAEQIAKSSSLTSISSLLDTVAILLAPGGSGAASQAKILLECDGGSHKYPIGGLYEEGDIHAIDGQECSGLVAWELLPNGKISVLSATPFGGLKLPMVPHHLDLESCLGYLDQLHEACGRTSVSDSDRLMIQRSAILELRHRLDRKEDLSTPSGLEGDMPPWWPEVVAYGRAQGVAPSPQKARRRGLVVLFEDVNDI